MLLYQVRSSSWPVSTVVVICQVTISVSWKVETKRRIDKNVNPFKNIKTSSLIVCVLVLLGSFLLAAFSYRMVIAQQGFTVISTPTSPAPTIPANTPTVAGTTTGTPKAAYP